MNTAQEIFEQKLLAQKRIHIKQVWEGFEITLGWETRNKYRLLDENNVPFGFAAERSTGISGTLLRQVLGHWRPFTIDLFSIEREKLYELNFPFRYFFKTLMVKETNGRHIGHLQQRFAIFRKKFDIYNKEGRIVARINSPFFKIWTFEFRYGKKKLGTLQKKWSGLLTEVYTDRDNFTVSYADASLLNETKILMLATCLMVDIVYFENNQSKKSLLSQ